MASEGAKKLAMRLVTRDMLAVEASAKRMNIELESREDVIDAAVAPLVALANFAGHRMTCRALVSDMAHPCDCGFTETNKALEQWRTGR